MGAPRGCPGWAEGAGEQRGPCSEEPRPLRCHGERSGAASSPQPLEPRVRRRQGRGRCGSPGQGLCLSVPAVCPARGQPDRRDGSQTPPAPAGDTGRPLPLGAAGSPSASRSLQGPWAAAGWGRAGARRMDGAPLAGGRTRGTLSECGGALPYRARLRASRNMEPLFYQTQPKLSALPLLSWFWLPQPCSCTKPLRSQYECFSVSV